MAPALLDRIQAALDAGAATSTADLRELLIAAGGETCFQRGRLQHRLSLLLHSLRPPMATSTTHRFKAAFRGKDFSGFPLVVGGETKIVTAKNLADEDIEPLKRHGGGHLIEPIDAEVAPGAPGVQTVNSSILHTAIETGENSITIKHSSGGPDDLPIEAPAELQPQASAPAAIPVPDPKPQPQPKKDAKA